MRWAPGATRSHLIEYLTQLEHSSQGLYQHSGLALITESVLQYAGYNKPSLPLGVRYTFPCMCTKSFGIIEGMCLECTLFCAVHIFIL